MKKILALLLATAMLVSAATLMIGAEEGDEESTDLLDYIIDLKNFYQGNTKETLDDLLSRYSTTRKKWLKKWEKVE